MSRWFRLYDTLLDDPKVQRLPDHLFKTWVNLLCLASRSNGDLPCIEDIAFALRLDDAEAAARLAALVERGLIDNGDVARPHNWSERQFLSDGDPTAADRQRRKRDKARHVTRDNEECHAHVTRDTSVTSRPPDTETDTDTDDGISQRAREAPDLAELETKLRHAAGWEHEPAPNLCVTGPVAALIQAGADLYLDVLPAVRAHAPKARSRTSWKYFLGAITQARDDRLNALAAVHIPAIPGAISHARTHHAARPSRGDVLGEIYARAIAAAAAETDTATGGDGIDDAGTHPAGAPAN